MASNLIPENFEFKRNALAHIDRCFVLGNGPTLNKYNLEALNNELTFGVNRICRTGFTPDFIGFIDPRVFSKDKFDDLPDKKFRIIANPYMKDFIIKKYNNTYYPIKIVKSILSRNVFEHNQLWYGDFDLIRSSFSVLGDFALPAAIYLGIKNIYILGMDFFWTSPQYLTRHAYDQEGQKNYHMWDIDVPGKEIFSATMAKYDLLASQLGVRIYNASPGSAILCFRKIIPKDLPVNLSLTCNIKDALEKYIVIKDRIYKIIPSLTGEENAISLVDIISRKYLTWLPGPWYTPRLLRIEDINGYAKVFINNATFLLETGFTDKNKISLSTLDRKFYIVKHPYEDRYSMQPFTGEFDACLSSFELFSTISKALSFLKTTQNIELLSLDNDILINLLEKDINKSTSDFQDYINESLNKYKYIYTYHNSYLSFDPQKGKLFHGKTQDNFISYSLENDKICLYYKNDFLNYSDSKNFHLSVNKQLFDIVKHSTSASCTMGGKDILQYISIKIDDRFLTAWKDGTIRLMPHCLEWEKYYI